MGVAPRTVSTVVCSRFDSGRVLHNIAAPMRTVEATSRPATLLWESVDFWDETA